jgi:voltage-gated potassium channel
MGSGVDLQEVCVPELGLMARVAVLCEGNSPTVNRFRHGLQAFDIGTILSLIARTFFHRQTWVLWVDVMLGVSMAADCLARFWIDTRKRSLVFQPLNIADLVATLSFLAPLVGGGFFLLRSLRVRLIQTMFRPSKLGFTCKDFGLFLHEADAVHCKHCGAVLNIPSDGEV